MNPQALREELHDSVADTPVGPPPLAQIHRQANRARRGRTTGIAAAAAIVLIAGAATTVGILRDGPDPGPAGSDGPVLTVLPDPERPWPAALIQGTLTLHDGCLFVGDSVAVWPAGTSWDADSQHVQFDGDAYALGQPIAGGGGVLDAGSGLNSLLGPDTAEAARACVETTGAVGLVQIYPEPGPREPQPNDPTKPEATDVVGSWQISSMARYDVFRGRLTNEYIRPNALTLTFTEQTWRVESGCPHFSGSYILSAGAFQYHAREPEFSSGSRCPEVDYADGHLANVANLIHQAKHVTITGGHLYLHADNWKIILDATR